MEAAYGSFRCELSKLVCRLYVNKQTRMRSHLWQCISRRLLDGCRRWGWPQIPYPPFVYDSSLQQRAQLTSLMA